jgi:hypothetical protein
MMNDYSLILLCKKGNQKAQLELFHKYERYLHKKYASFKRNLLYNYITFDDFKNEAFLWFMKAINYTNPDKITSPSKWQFLTPYMYYINNMLVNLTTQTKSYNVIPNTPLLELDRTIETNKEIDQEFIDTLSRDTEFDDSVSRKVIEKIQTEEFIKTLSPFQTNIMKSAEVLERNKVPSIDTLAKRFKISKAWMACKVHDIKVKFKKFEKDYGY